MRIKTLVLAGLVLWAWSGVPAFSQELPVLQFVKKNDLAIDVEPPDEHARACGITRTGLDAAVRLPLARNGFSLKTLVTSDNTDFLNITVTSIRNSGGCFVVAELVFRRQVSLIVHSDDLDRFIFDPSNPARVLEFIWDYWISGAVVWEKGELLTGPSSGMSQRVYDSLEGFTNEWIAKWLIDNPQQ